MGLQDICREVVEETEGALDCAVVDLHTGLVLASAHEAGTKLSQRQLDAAVRTGSSVFGSRLIGRFCDALAKHGASDSGPVQEIQVATASNYQFMAAIPGWNDALIILFTEKTLRLGLGWMAVHQAQARCAESRDTEADPAWDPVPLQPESAPIESGPEPTAAPQAPPPAADARPIPPPPVPVAEDTIPNPLAARNRSGESPDTPGPASRSSDSAQANPDAPPTTRGKMFRRRSNRKGQ